MLKLEETSSNGSHVFHILLLVLAAALGTKNTFMTQ